MAIKRRGSASWQGGLKDGTPIRIIPPEATTQLGTTADRPVHG